MLKNLKNCEKIEKQLNLKKKVEIWCKIWNKVQKQIMLKHCEQIKIGENLD